MMQRRSIDATVEATIGLLLVAMLASGCGEAAPASRNVERVLGPMPSAVTSVAIDHGGAMWIASADGALARRAGDAATFEPVALGDGGALWDLAAASDGGVLVAGDDGRAFAVTELDAVPLSSGTRAPLRGIAGSTTRAYAVGGPPATLVVVGRDVAPEPLDLPTDVPADARLMRVVVLADGSAHVVGERGVYLVVRDGVVTSSPVPGGPHLVDLDGAGRCPLIAVGGADAGDAIELDGEDARRISPGVVPPLTSVAADERRAIAVGLLGTAIERDCDGDAWVPIAGLDPDFDALSVVVDRDDVAWVAGGRAFDNSFSRGALWRIGRGAGPRWVTRDPDAQDAADGDADALDDGVTGCPVLPEAAGLELGERVLGCFVPYVDGGIAHVVNGPQGGSHVELSVRYPAAALAATRVHLRALLVVDQTTAARFELDGLPTELEGTTATRVTSDVPVIFAGSDPSPWLEREGRLDVLVDGGGMALTRTLTVHITR